MSKQSENTDKLFTPSNIIVLLLVLCSYLILFFGHTFSERNWGLDQILYLSGPLYIFWIIISILSIILLLLEIKKHWLSDLLYDFLWGNKKLYGRWLFVLLGMFLFYYFRFEAHLYGDGYIRIGNFAQKSKPIIPWFEYGSTLIPYGFYKVLTMFGAAKLEASIFAYQLVSVISGGVYLFFSIKVSDFLYENYHDKITSLFLLILSGLIIMFFGMVENFPILLALGSLFIYLITQAVKTYEKKYLIYLLILTVIGIIINFQFITFVPILFYIIIKLFIRQTKTGRITGFLIGLGVIAAGVTILYIQAARNIWLENLILLMRGKLPEADYWLFSQIHLMDIFNLIFLLVPLFLIFVYAALLAFKKLRKEDLFLIFSLLFFAQLAYLMILDPKNGMIREIPQYCFLLYGFILLGIYSLLKLRRTINLSQSLVMGLCPVVFVLILPTLMVHLSPSKTEESINKYLTYNEIKNNSALIALRDHFFAAGNMDKSNYYDQRIVNKSPGLLQSRLVDDLYAHDRYTESLNYANQLVERYPYNFSYRIKRANLLKFYKKFVEAKAELDTAIMLAPYKTEPYHFLAEFYREQKLDQQCFDILEKAISIDPDNVIILVDLTAYYFRTGLIEQADSISKSILAIDSTEPYAYMYQGLIAENQKRYEKALEYYARFIELNDKLPDVPLIRKRENRIYLLLNEKNQTD